MPRFLTDDPVGSDKYGLSGGAVAGPYAFAGGMALDMETFGRTPDADTIADETRVVLDQCAGTIAEAGFALSDIVRATCYLSAPEYAEEMTAAFRGYFAPAAPPVQNIIVAGIAGECRVEIDVFAVRGSGTPR